MTIYFSTFLAFYTSEKKQKWDGSISQISITMVLKIAMLSILIDAGLLTDGKVYNLLT